MKSFLVFILCFLGLSGCGSNSVRYENKQYGFSLLLPAGWKQEEGYQGTIIIARAPEESPKFKTNINLTIGDLSGIEAKAQKKIKLVEFYEINKAQLFEVLPGVKYNIREDYINAGNNAGMLLSFSCDIEKVPLRFMAGIWMVASKAYTITCSTERDKFESYLPVFERTLKSLRVK